MLNLQPAVTVAQLANNITSLVNVLVSEVKKSECFKNEKDIENFVVNINNFFISDSIFQNVYTKCEQGFDMNVLNNDEKLRSQIVSYLEFFRQIYQYSDNMFFLRNADLYFRVPFFFVVNNPIIQENIIFNDFDRFGFLFDLYEIWLSKIKNKNLKSNSYIDIFGNRQLLIENEYIFLPLQEFDLIDRYIVHKFALNGGDDIFFKRILKDGELHKFKINKINNPSSIYIKKVLKMNNPNDKESWINDAKYYLKSTKDELEYAAKSEYLWVIEEQNKNKKMAAAAVFIANPKYEPKDDEGNYTFNFSKECLSSLAGCDEFSIFDSVIVNNSYQGLGFQRLLLMLAKEIAKKNNKKFIYATVSEFNSYSYKNLVLSGYKWYDNVSYKVKNHKGEFIEYQRHLMRLNII